MIKLNDTEWQIMNVVWDQHEVSVRQVYEALYEDTGWAYSTVKTFLNRLVDKQVLTVNAKGHSHLYRPHITRQKAQSSAVSGLLNTVFDGTVGSLVSYLAKEKQLTQRERQQLQQLLKELGDKT